MAVFVLVNRLMELQYCSHFLSAWLIWTLEKKTPLFYWQVVKMLLTPCRVARRYPCTCMGTTTVFCWGTWQRGWKLQPSNAIVPENSHWKISKHTSKINNHGIPLTKDPQLFLSKQMLDAKIKLKKTACKTQVTNWLSSWKISKSSKTVNFFHTPSPFLFWEMIVPYFTFLVTSWLWRLEKSLKKQFHIFWREKHAMNVKMTAKFC